MSILRNSANTHDDTTGKLVGYINPLTQKEEVLDATAIQALVSEDRKVAARRKDRALTLQSGALVQAPLWAAATAYVVGDTVRLSTGQIIICQTAGTSAGSAPTFNSGALITDNTVTWGYTGRMSKALSGYEVPTITTSSTAPAGSTARRWTTGSSAGITANLPILLPCGTSLVAISNAFTIQDNFYNNGSNVQINSQAAGLNATMQVFEFITDDPKPGIGTWNNGGQPIFDVYVGDPSGDNMVLVEEFPTKMVSGNPCWYILDWTGGSGRKSRRYRIELRWTGSGTFTNLYGLAYQASSAISAPSVDGARMLWIGDSFTTTTSPGFAAQNPFNWKTGPRALKYAGARFAQCIGQDGAGYVAGSTTAGASSSKVTVPLALSGNPALSSTPFDVVVFAPGLNDTPFASQVQAAALQSFQSARALWPRAFIIVFGAQNGPNNNGAAVVAIDAAILAAFTQWADSYSAFQSTISDGGGAWVSGTGKVGTTTGDGSADYYVGPDGTHPPQWACEYLATRYGAHVDRILSAVGR